MCVCFSLFADPYVKIKLLDRKGKRIGKKKKTSVKMGNLNPYFNESFVFLVEQEQLRVIMVPTHYTYRMRHQVGHTEILMKSNIRSDLT